MTPHLKRVEARAREMAKRQGCEMAVFHRCQGGSCACMKEAFIIIEREDQIRSEYESRIIALEAAMDKPFTLRMAGHELIGVEATENIIEQCGASWLAFTLLTLIESQNLQTPTAKLLREWSDRRDSPVPTPNTSAER